MKDKTISKIYDKHYKNKKKGNPVAVKVANKKETIKKTEKIKAFRIRKSGVLRISEKHITGKYGFKPLQEVEIENPQPGTIIIKGK